MAPLALATASTDVASLLHEDEDDIFLRAVVLLELGEEAGRFGWAWVSTGCERQY